MKPLLPKVPHQQTKTQIPFTSHQMLCLTKNGLYPVSQPLNTKPTLDSILTFLFFSPQTRVTMWFQPSRYFPFFSSLFLLFTLYPIKPSCLPPHVAVLWVESVRFVKHWSLFASPKWSSLIAFLKRFYALCLCFKVWRAILTWARSMERSRRESESPGKVFHVHI